MCATKSCERSIEDLWARHFTKRRLDCSSRPATHEEEGLREKQPYGITPSFQIPGIEAGWERCNVDSGEGKILLSPHCRLFYTLSSGDGYTWIILSPPHCPSYLLPTITFFILAGHKSGQSIKLQSLFFFATYILQHTLYHNPSQLLQRAICTLAGQARPLARPTMQPSSVQLVITESSSSETSREDGTPLWNSAALHGLLLAGEVLPAALLVAISETGTVLSWTNNNAPMCQSGLFTRRFSFLNKPYWNYQADRICVFHLWALLPFFFFFPFILRSM